VDSRAKGNKEVGNRPWLTRAFFFHLTNNINGGHNGR